MAQFMARIRGKGEGVHRTGTKKSGLIVSAEGWSVGARIYVEHQEGRDVVRVYRTNGHARAFEYPVCKFDDNGPLPLDS